MSGNEQGAEYAPTDADAEQAGKDAAEQTEQDLDNAGMDNNDAPEADKD